MAENLHYKPSVNYSSFYDSATYGRLYSWNAAMEESISYASVTLGDSIHHQGACPDDWHVPLSSEWDTLEDFVGGSDSAQIYLKSKTGWDSTATSIKGLDTYDFSALPGGYCYSTHYNDDSISGYWKTATKYSPKVAYARFMYTLGTSVLTTMDDKLYRFSLRCVED